MVRKITWFAFVFGMFFPIIGVFAEIYSRDLELSMSNVALVSKESLTLPIVYSAPAVLSFV